MINDFRRIRVAFGVSITSKVDEMSHHHSLVIKVVAVVREMSQKWQK